jgi:hypothetical protein
MRDKLLCVLLYVVINQSVIQISNLCLDSVLRDLAIAVDDTTVSMVVFMLAMLAGMRAFYCHQHTTQHQSLAASFL